MILYKRNLLTGFIVILLALGLFTALIGCDNRAEPPGGVDGLEGALELSADRPSVDFGMVEAEAGSKELSVTLTNTGSEAITVESAVLSDTTNYSLTTETLPLTMEPEATTTVTGTFHPQASGTLEATLSVKAAGIEEELVLTLTGSGNYAPEVGMGYYALIDTAQGFYVETGEKNGKPMYTRITDTAMYMYYVPDPTPESSIIARFAAANEGQGWVIDSTTNVTEYINADFRGPDAETPESATEWSSGTVNAIDKPYIDGTPMEYSELKVFYSYSDQDDDTESGTEYQWYRQYGEGGSWEPVSGATGQTYVPQTSDIDYYIRAGVTPKAATGIPGGVEILSDEVGPVFSMPQ